MGTRRGRPLARPILIIAPAETAQHDFTTTAYLPKNSRASIEIRRVQGSHAVTWAPRPTADEHLYGSRAIYHRALLDKVIDILREEGTHPIVLLYDHHNYEAVVPHSELFRARPPKLLELLRPLEQLTQQNIAAHNQDTQRLRTTPPAAIRRHDTRADVNCAFTAILGSLGTIDAEAARGTSEEPPPEQRATIRALRAAVVRMLKCPIDGPRIFAGCAINSDNDKLLHTIAFLTRPDASASPPRPYWDFAQDAHLQCISNILNVPLLICHDPKSSGE